MNYTGQQRQNPVLIEHNSILTKSGQNELISYRIPYKNLLFIKEGDIYNSSFSITFEFYKDDKFILREILNPELSVNEYDKTLSDEFYFQDYFQTSLSPGTYTLRSILSLGSTDVEYKIPDHKIDVDSTYKSKIVGPIIVVNSEKFSNEQTLANFGNSIPFSPTKYNLLIGLNTETDSLSINISQNDKVVFSEIFRSESNGNLSVKKVDNEIVLEFADSSEYEYFLVNGFSHLLYEGQFEITFSFSGTATYS